MFGFIVEPNSRSVGLRYDVMIGQNVSGLIDDKTGTGASALEVPVRLIRGVRHTEEIKEIERVRGLTVPAAAGRRSIHRSLSVDIDHCRVNCRCYLGKC